MSSQFDMFPSLFGDKIYWGDDSVALRQMCCSICGSNRYGAINSTGGCIRVLNQGDSSSMERAMSTGRASVVVNIFYPRRYKYTTFEFRWTDCSYRLVETANLVAQLGWNVKYSIIYLWDTHAQLIENVHKFMLASSCVNHYTYMTGRGVSHSWLYLTIVEQLFYTKLLCISSCKIFRTGWGIADRLDCDFMLGPFRTSQKRSRYRIFLALSFK